jgi:hypothetical protein
MSLSIGWSLMNNATVLSAALLGISSSDTGEAFGPNSQACLERFLNQQETQFFVLALRDH